MQQTVIQPRSGWQIIDWRELRDYRDLFYFLVWRDVSVLYKQTILGFSWAVIRPVFSMIVFSLIFGTLAKMPSDGVPYPVFAFAALLPWTYFSTAMINSTASLVTNAHLLTKVYFPRLILPLTPVFAGLVEFGIAALVLAALMTAYGIAPTLNALFLPVLIAIMILASAGFGLWLSALALQYRDVKYATQFMAQLLMYAAPVVWPVSLIGETFPVWGDWIRIVYGLFPMAGVIEGFRAALLDTTPMPWDLILTGGVSASLLALTGALYFRRMERTFADLA